EDRKLAEALLAGEKRLLEMMARGDALALILDALCRLVEEQSGNVLCSVLMLDRDGIHLPHGATPSLPRSYTDAVDGLAIGPRAGSCGLAAYPAERADASACLQWLATDRPDLDSVREALGAVVKDGERAAEVIGRIRALLSRTAVAREPCDLAGVVHEVLSLVGPELRRQGIALQTVLTPELPPVLGDRIQLQQVLLNLLVNAAEAMRETPPERRRLVVRSSVASRDDEVW